MAPPTKRGRGRPRKVVQPRSSPPTTKSRSISSITTRIHVKREANTKQPIISEQPSFRSDSSLNTTPVRPFQAIWQNSDEITLLRALHKYFELHHCRLPQNKYAEFIVEHLQNKLTFLPTEKNLYNKLGVFRRKYKKYANNPDAIKSGHSRMVFELCKKIFEEEEEEEERGGEDEERACKRYVLLSKLMNEEFPEHTSKTVSEVVRMLGQSKAQKLEDHLKEAKDKVVKARMKEVKLKIKTIDELMKL